MADLTKYNPSIAWFTIAESVCQLTRETVDDVAAFRITVKAVDTNNIGQGQKAIDYTFTDNIGVPYKIIDTATTTIDVADVFRQGCPVGGKIGIVHKSAYKGHSVHLPSELLYRLHPIAASNNNKYAMAILWGNDPNPLRIPFTATNNPQITGYQSPQTISGKVYNLAEDYGENPKVRLMQIDESGNTIHRTELSYFQLVAGLIDSIVFGTFSDLITGYLEISR